jgi:hypothetical protein
MRTLVACMMTLLLLSVITVCPLLACPMMAGAPAGSHSTCHKSPHHSEPCAPKAQNCPYTILAASKTKPVAADALAVTFIQVVPPLPLPAGFSGVTWEGRLIDAEGIFLRNRVILI